METETQIGGPRPARMGIQTLADAGLFLALAAAGLATIPAHLLAFGAAAVAVSVRGVRPRRIPGFVAVLALAAILRAMLLVVLLDRVGMPEFVAVLLAAALSAFAIDRGMALFVLPAAGPSSGDAPGWRRVGLALVVYTVVLRLFAMAGLDLLPEETYYWNYGEHLDIGYLDHPLMAGWSIRLFTGILGDHELGVRLPALIFWGIGATFLFRLTRNLLGRTAGYRAVILYSSLPIYLGVGVMITPDSPLFACWAATLFFLERALLANRRSAWLLVGVFLGLGMLSKYTIGLLGASTLVFMVLDPRSRKWFIRPEPYLCVAIASVLFSPVLIWNATHDWMSFAFQTKDRLAMGGDFSLHLMIASIMGVITPIGFFAAAVAFFTKRDAWKRPGDEPDQPARKKRFALVYTLAPLSVFIAFSLDIHPKFNWVGPVWIAILPLMGLQLAGGAGSGPAWAVGALRRIWPPTVAILLILLGGGLAYIAVGLPGIAPMDEMRVPVAWRQYGEKVDQIADRLRDETGEEPVIAGMDLYFLSAEVSFYQRRENPRVVAGRHLNGRDSVMWRFWTPAEQVIGKNVVLLGQDRKTIRDREVEGLFDRLSPIVSEPVLKDGKPISDLFWRIGYGYRGLPAASRD